MLDIDLPPLEDDGVDPLDFVPVPAARIRHNGWNPQRQRDFIQALAVMGNVTRAARAVGCSAQSAYKLRERPGAESFAAAWDSALVMAYHRVFGMAMDRALNGVVTPRYYKGKVVGVTRTFDMRLAMVAIAAPIPPHRLPPCRPDEEV